MNEVRIIASGGVGSGKSALLGEIEIMLKAIGVPVSYQNRQEADSQKRMTHADWTAELEIYRPVVVLVEAPAAARAPAVSAQVDALTDEQRHALAHCINGGAQMGWVSDADARAILAASQPAALHIPANFTTHRSSWRDAIVKARDSAAPKSDDSDDAAYWQHELDAYDRAFSRLLAGELKDGRAQPVAPISEQDAALWIDPENSGYRVDTPLYEGVSMVAITGTTHKWGVFTKPLYATPQPAVPVQAVDPVVAANRDLLLSRSQVGIKKYGVTLHDAGLTERELLVHALEEALDLANYIQANLQRVDSEAAPVQPDQQQAPEGWRPIATAPRDGRNILVCFGQDGVSQAKYIPGLPYPWQFIDTNNGISWLVNAAVDAIGGPSGWKPMPAAPAPGEQA